MSKNPAADNSGALFDAIKTKNKLKRDYELAKYLGEHNSQISQIRQGKREISDIMLVRICDKTGMTLKAARAKIAERAQQPEA